MGSRRGDSAAPLVLALDIGTSSVKAALYDAGAREVPGTRVHQVHAPRVTDDGGSEFDAEALLAATAATIDATLSAAGEARARVRAVGTATFWHALLGADAEGRPVTPVYTWADVRAAGYATRLAERVDAAAVHARTGCPIHPSFFPCKLLWLADARPDAFRTARWWGSFGEWLLGRLFGRADAPVSISMASATGLLDQARERWDDELLALLRLDPATLSPIGDLADLSTGLAAGWAARWPALAQVPWLPAVGDGATGQIGSGCLGPDRLALNVGTSSALRVAAPGRPAPPPAGLFGYRVHRDLGVFGGALNEGGNLVAWLRDTLRLPPPGEAEAAVDAMRPDAHGLTLLPLFAGERAPGWRGALKGAISGLTLATGPVEILRAAMEAVALRLATVHDRLAPLVAAGAPVVASGGGVLVSRAWQRILADALGRPLLASGEPEATTRGAAMLALRQIGALSSLDQARARLGARVDPDPERHAAYRVALERQQALDERLFAP